MPLSQDIGSGDIDHLTVPNNRTRACTLCRQKEHGKFQCPILLAYGSTPLPNGNLHVRQTLAMNLSQINKFSVHKRTNTDIREVLKIMPNKIPALVIHKTYPINTTLAVTMVPEYFFV